MSRYAAIFTGQRIVQRACDLTGLTVPELMGPCRVAEVVGVRWACMVAMRLNGMSIAQIGRRIGGRDHTTVIHGLRKAESLIEHDRDFAALAAALEAA